MTPTGPRSKPSGYVATGPGFYVWEERRADAERSARELIPTSEVPPVAYPATPGAPRRSR